MNSTSFYFPSIWKFYSKKMEQKIAFPRFGGVLSKEEPLLQRTRLIVASQKNLIEEYEITWYWLIDQEDGRIADVRYQMFGPSILIGVLEVTSEILLGKNCSQVNQIRSTSIDRELRDKQNPQGFPQEIYRYFDEVIATLQKSIGEWNESSLSEVAHAEKQFSGWNQLSKREKLSLIDQLLDREIRPYIHLDGGEIELQDLSDSDQLIILYKGACTTCVAATGSTLDNIQQLLRKNLSITLVVIPNFSENQ